MTGKEAAEQGNVTSADGGQRPRRGSWGGFTVLLIYRYYNKITITESPYYFLISADILNKREEQSAGGGDRRETDGAGIPFAEISAEEAANPPAAGIGESPHLHGLPRKNLRRMTALGETAARRTERGWTQG